VLGEEAFVFKEILRNGTPITLQTATASNGLGTLRESVIIQSGGNEIGIHGASNRTV
jgi:hypothetical protein